MQMEEGVPSMKVSGIYDVTLAKIQNLRVSSPTTLLSDLPETIVSLPPKVTHL